MGRLDTLLEGLRALKKVGELPGVPEARDAMLLEVGQLVFRVWEEEGQEKPQSKQQTKTVPPTKPVELTEKVCVCGCGRQLPFKAWRGLYSTCREAFSEWCRQNGQNSRSVEGLQAWKEADCPLPEAVELPQKRERKKHDWEAYSKLDSASDRDRYVAGVLASGGTYADAARESGLSVARISQIGNKLWALQHGHEPQRRGRARSTDPSSDEEYSPVAA